MRIRHLLAVALVLTGCSSADDALEEGGDDSAALEIDPEPDDAISQASWSTIGNGVSYKSLDEGSNILIVYGGYSAQDAYVKRWTAELARAKGSSLGIKHIYAVRGPNQSLYANREIQNSRLAAHLADQRAAGASSIIVAAHSSGAFVAGELFGMLKNGRGGEGTLGKVTAFNLDGGGGVPAATLRAMKNAYFVYACDDQIGRCSQNTGSMKSLGSSFSSLGGAIKVDADGSGCSARAAGGGWCLHDTLITTRPHNPAMYDLRRDYQNFNDRRRVVTSYLDVLQ